MARIRHLSATQLVIYSDCGLRWKLFYGGATRIYMPMTGPMLGGAAIDRAISYYYHQMLKHSIPTRDDLIGVADDHFYANLDKTKLTSKDGPIRDRFPWMIDNFLDCFGTLLVPYDDTAIQAKIEVPITVSGLDIMVIGYIDLVTDKRIIVDFKTTTTKKSPKFYASDFQLLTYAWATGIRSTAAAVLYTKKYTCDFHAHVRDDDQIKSIEERYKAVAAAIMADIYLPANKGTSVCSSFMCPVYDECTFGSKATADPLMSDEGIDE